MSVCFARYCDPLVVALCGENGVGRHVWIGGAVAARSSSVDLLVEQLGSQEMQRSFELGKVDVLTLTGSTSMFERGHDQHDGQTWGYVVGVCSEWSRRGILSGQPVTG